MQDDATMATVETVPPRMTFADLERMPDDGRRYELYDGEVVVVPSPLPRHQIVQHRLTEVIGAYARESGGFCVDSPIDIVFTERVVLQPDIVYFSRERRHLIDLGEVIRHAPDLCVEILSSSTASRDRGVKMTTFARFGVSEYWIVDPVAAAIEVYELGPSGYTLCVHQQAGVLTSAMLPGLRIALQRIFDGLG